MTIPPPPPVTKVEAQIAYPVECLTLIPAPPEPEAPSPPVDPRKLGLWREAVLEGYVWRLKGALNFALDTHNTCAEFHQGTLQQEGEPEAVAQVGQ